jgi:hypothetical protein
MNVGKSLLEERSKGTLERLAVSEGDARAVAVHTQRLTMWINLVMVGW